MRIRSQSKPSGILSSAEHEEFCVNQPGPSGKAKYSMHCTAGQFTLGYQYDTAVLGFPETVLDEFFQLVHFRTEFRDNGCFCSGGDGAVQSEETCKAAWSIRKPAIFEF